MNLTFYPCRLSPMSRFGLYSAALFYPLVAAALLFVSFFLGIEIYINGNYTSLQVVIVLFAMTIAILLASFLFVISRNCYLMERRRIALDRDGFVVKARNERRYNWHEIGGIGIIAYAASVSKQVYQTQICIFIEPVSDEGLKRLRDSYLYGAFNQHKYVLLDYETATLNKINSQGYIQIDDFRVHQMKL